MDTLMRDLRFKIGSKEGRQRNPSTEDYLPKDEVPRAEERGAVSGVEWSGREMRAVRRVECSGVEWSGREMRAVRRV
jgi:hypothetical protein